MDVCPIVWFEDRKWQEIGKQPRTKSYVVSNGQRFKLNCKNTGKGVRVGKESAEGKP